MNPETSFAEAWNHQQEEITRLTERIKELENNFQAVNEVKQKVSCEHLKFQIEIRDLTSELQAEQKVVDFYADDSNWWEYNGTEEYISARPNDIDDNYFGEGQHLGGKRARQRQAERKIKLDGI